MKGDPFKTKNYSIFQNDEANREVDNIKRLVASMKRWGYIKAYPIHVTRDAKSKKLVVKDGGHRLAAAKAVGCEVYYVCCDGQDISIPDINNTQRRWTLRNYIQSNARQGKMDYVRLIQFSEKHRINLQTSGRLLFGEQAMSGNADKAIKTGTFRVKNESYATRVATILTALKPYTDLVLNTSFISAVSRCCLVPEFEASRLIHNASRVPFLFVPKATIEEFVSMIEEIYNHKISSKNRVPLKFKADQISVQRRKLNGKGATS